MTCETHARALSIAAGKIVVRVRAISIVVSHIDVSFFASHRQKLSAFALIIMLVALVSETILIAGLRLKLVLDGLKRKCRLRETFQVALSGFFFEQVAFG